MLRNKHNHSPTGAFTLIEVVIFIAISSVILIAMISLSVNITRQSIISRHKVYATHYADELAQWLRIQKDIGWQNFYTYSQSSPSTQFCVNDIITLDSDLTLMSSMTSLADCPYGGIGTTATEPGPKIFRRYVEFPVQTDNTKSVKGTIRVEWLEAGNALYDVQIETLFAPR